MPLDPPSQDDLRRLKERGHESWEEYIRSQADSYGVPYETALMVFDMLGTDEAFDSFVSMLQEGL